MTYYVRVPLMLAILSTDVSAAYRVHGGIHGMFVCEGCVCMDTRVLRQMSVITIDKVYVRLSLLICSVAT